MAKRLASSLLIVLMLLSPLMLSAKCTPPGWEDWPQGYQKFGPRADDVLFESLGWQLGLKLLSGSVDLVELDPGPLEDFPSCVSEYNEGLSMVQIDINNMHFPMGHVSFRRALAHLVNKLNLGEIYMTQPDGEAQARGVSWVTSIDTPVPLGLAEFVNPSVPTYEYSRQLAIEILDSSGFRDWDNDTFREGPNHEEFRLKTWSPHKWIPGDPVWILVPAWPEMHAMLEAFLTELRAIGIDCYYEYPSPPFLGDTRVGSAVTRNLDEVIELRDYDFYFDRILVEPSLDYLCSLYNSSFISYAWPWNYGANWVCFSNAGYDSASSNLMFTQTWDGVRQYAYECQQILATEVPVIPVFNEVSRTLHQRNYGNHMGEQQYQGKEWVHTVNENARGFDSYWSFLNMHPADYERGGTIRYGTKSGIGSINPIYSRDKAGWAFLYLVYDTLLRKNPYSPSDFTSWLVSGYQIGAWASGSTITIALLPNVLWQDFVQLTAYDIKFTFDYMKTEVAGWHYSKLANIDHVDVANQLTAIIYLKAGIIALNWLEAIPIVPKHIFEGKDPEQDPEDYDGVIGTGPYRCYKDGVIGRVDKDSLGQYWHLQSNPIYFKELIQPDFACPPSGPGMPVQPGHDGIVDADDFGMTIGKFGETKPWTDPEWGPVADVNKDACVDVDDIMETGSRYGLTGCMEGYPPYYVDPPGLRGQSSTVTFNNANTAKREVSSRQTLASDNLYLEGPLPESFSATVSVYPEIAAAKLCETFVVSVVVSNVTNLYGWQFKMSFNSTVVTPVYVIEGSFFADAGDTVFATKVNSTSGLIMASSTLWPYPSQGVTGDGILATVTFYVHSDGATFLDFSETKLRTVIGDSVVPIDHNSTNGDFVPIEKISLDIIECSSQTEPHTAEETVDGNYTSYWQSEKRKTTNQWIKCALPTNYNLTSLKILPYGSGYGVKNFKLLVSPDGVTYTEAYSNTAQDSSTLQTFELPGIISKYAQLYCVDTYGAPFYLRINEFELHGHITQNDANSGSDGGDTFRLATSISPSDYTGYADGSFDPDDWYKFNATAGKFINITMTPPTGWNYDLFLHDPFGYEKAISNTTGDATENILYKANSTVEWRLHISVCNASSKGEYSFTVEVMNALHVESISFWRGWQGQTEILFIRVKILDQNGTPISDATVSGILVPVIGGNEFYSGPTQSDGTVTFEYSVKNSELPIGTYRFTVTNVQKTEWIYDYAANKETSDTYTKGTPH